MSPNVQTSEFGTLRGLASLQENAYNIRRNIAQNLDSQ